MKFSVILLFSRTWAMVFTGAQVSMAVELEMLVISDFRNAFLLFR